MQELLSIKFSIAYETTLKPFEKKLITDSIDSLCLKLILLQKHPSSRGLGIDPAIAPAISIDRKYSQMTYVELQNIILKKATMLNTYVAGLICGQEPELTSPFFDCFSLPICIFPLEHSLFLSQIKDMMLFNPLFEQFDVRLVGSQVLLHLLLTTPSPEIDTDIQRLIQTSDLDIQFVTKKADTLSEDEFTELADKIAIEMEKILLLGVPKRTFFVNRDTKFHTLTYSKTDIVLTTVAFGPDSHFSSNHVHLDLSSGSVVMKDISAAKHIFGRTIHIYNQDNLTIPAALEHALKSILRALSLGFTLSPAQEIFFLRLIDNDKVVKIFNEKHSSMIFPELYQPRFSSKDPINLKERLILPPEVTSDEPFEPKFPVRGVFAVKDREGQESKESKESKDTITPASIPAEEEAQRKRESAAQAAKQQAQQKIKKIESSEEKSRTTIASEQSESFNKIAAASQANKQRAEKAAKKRIMDEEQAALERERKRALSFAIRKQRDTERAKRCSRNLQSKHMVSTGTTSTNPTHNQQEEFDHLDVRLAACRSISEIIAQTQISSFLMKPEPTVLDYQNIHKHLIHITKQACWEVSVFHDLPDEYDRYQEDFCGLIINIELAISKLISHYSDKLSREQKKDFIKKYCLFIKYLLKNNCNVIKHIMMHKHLARLNDILLKFKMTSSEAEVQASYIHSAIGIMLTDTYINNPVSKTYIHFVFAQNKPSTEIVQVITNILGLFRVVEASAGIKIAILLLARRADTAEISNPEILKEYALALEHFFRYQYEQEIRKPREAKIALDLRQVYMDEQFFSTTCQLLLPYTPSVLAEQPLPTNFITLNDLKACALTLFRIEKAKALTHVIFVKVTDLFALSPNSSSIYHKMFYNLEAVHLLNEKNILELTEMNNDSFLLLASAVDTLISKAKKAHEIHTLFNAEIFDVLIRKLADLATLDSLLTALELPEPEQNEYYFTFLKSITHDENSTEAINKVSEILAHLKNNSDAQAAILCRELLTLPLKFHGDYFKTVDLMMLEIYKRRTIPTGNPPATSIEIGSSCHEEGTDNPPRAELSSEAVTQKEGVSIDTDTHDTVPARLVPRI